MRRVTVKFLIGFGESQETVDFEYEVADDFEFNEESVAPIYEEFRREAILDIEDVECSECGYSLGQCGCDNDEEEE